MKRLFSKPEPAWLIAAIISAALLIGAIFLPLWSMELMAPQYPAGLTMYAYGDHFQGETAGYYENFDAVKEINALNHYIGMKPLKEVTEMTLFIPGVLLTIATLILVSFISWYRRWFRSLAIIGAWSLPLFFVIDLQYWLYNYGHTMDPDAALDAGDITPKVWGTTEVWNFHSVNRFEIGFLLMVLSALTITFLPPAIRLIQARRARAASAVTESVNTGATPVQGKLA